MKRWQNLLIQLVGLVGQAGNIYAGIVPAKYQPLVALGLTVAQGISAWYAHNYNPDGTPASTAFVKTSDSKTPAAPVIILLASLFAASGLRAQTTTPPDVSTLFAVKTTVMNLHIAGQNNPGTDLSGSYLFMSHGKTDFLAVTDSLLVPGNNFQGYYGGLGLAWQPDRLFSKTNLPKNSFQVYGALEGGIARNVPASGTSTSKPSFFTHAGLNYDPTHTGKFSINVVDGGFVYAPNLGYPSPASNGWTLSVGIKLGLWTKQN